MDTFAPIQINQNSDVESLLKSADGFSKQNDYPSALKVYHQALDVVDEKDPVLFEIYKNMGNIYLKCGDIEAAEEKYNLANAINSQDESLMVNYGVLCIQKGEYRAAKDRFASVVEQNKSSDLAWVGLGLVHRAHADHDLARACLQRALDENSQNKIAITHYYEWCIQDGIDAPDTYIATFLDQSPNDPDMIKLANGLNQ